MQELNNTNTNLNSFFISYSSSLNISTPFIYNEN